MFVRAREVQTEGKVYWGWKEKEGRTIKQNDLQIECFELQLHWVKTKINTAVEKVETCSLSRVQSVPMQNRECSQLGCEESPCTPRPGGVWS